VFQRGINRVKCSNFASAPIVPWNCGALAELLADVNCNAAIQDAVLMYFDEMILWMLPVVEAIFAEIVLRAQ
jgi:hypothetical protein